MSQGDQMTSLKQKIQKIKKGELTTVENVMQFGRKIKKQNKELNIFLHLNKDAIINNIKEKALEAVTGSLGDTLGDSLPIPDTTGGVIPELPKSPF